MRERVWWAVLYAGCLLAGPAWAAEGDLYECSVSRAELLSHRDDPDADQWKQDQLYTRFTLTEGERWVTMVRQPPGRDAVVTQYRITGRAEGVALSAVADPLGDASLGIWLANSPPGRAEAAFASNLGMAVNVWLLDCSLK